MVKSRRWTSSCGDACIHHVIRMAAVGVADVGAKRCHLDLQRRCRHSLRIRTTMTPNLRAAPQAARKKLLDTRSGVASVATS